jgi:hypothetical protein
MRQKRRQIYVNANIQEQVIISSGITFLEFIEYLSNPIENLMLITGGSSIILAESTLERGLELVEGNNLVNKLAQEDIYSLGNFCFVDYKSPCRTENLSEKQIAELLFLGHMFKPLDSPFFDILQNRFAYLAHDDGWYCKLYCRDPLEFMSVLCAKIKSHIESSFGVNIYKTPNSLINELVQVATEGLFIDLDKLSSKGDLIAINMYVCGIHENIDKVLNDSQRIMTDAHKVKCLTFKRHEKSWELR